MKIYDISPILSAKTAVFPGDQPFQRMVTHDLVRGDGYTLSNITTTLHIGAHTDAPSHYKLGGESIVDRDLSYYLGACQVVHCFNQRVIRPEHLGKILAPRVLFRTDSFPDANHWNGDFSALSPELIGHLKQQGVRLVGIDTPSIDPAEAKVLKAHDQIAKNDMAILEGIVLHEVPAGVYQLIALPLAIADGDASPVRAVLLPSHVKLADL